MVSAPECRKPQHGTCIERLADGWILATDLCGPCTEAFMWALDSISGPLVWHRNYLERAKG